MNIYSEYVLDHHVSFSTGNLYVLPNCLNFILGPEEWMRIIESSDTVQRNG